MPRWTSKPIWETGHRLLVHDDKRLEGDGSGAGSGGGGPPVEVTVVEVVDVAGSELMHDLTAADIHTYHVLAGDTPVLVHNCGGGIDGSWQLPATSFPTELVHTMSKGQIGTFAMLWLHPGGIGGFEIWG